MPVSHALSSVLTSTDEQVPGLLEVLAQVPDPRGRRGRRFGLVFLLAVAVICVLVGAKSFREIGDQAADLPQELLAALGGRPRPLRRAITAPSEKRIRTLLQDLDAAALDVITGGWPRALAAAGRLDRLLTAIAIDGKWLRGVGDGQVKLFATTRTGGSRSTIPPPPRPTPRPCSAPGSLPGTPTTPSTPPPSSTSLITSSEHHAPG
jgi:DDE_Tnp_1-associated